MVENLQEFFIKNNKQRQNNRENLKRKYVFHHDFKNNNVIHRSVWSETEYHKKSKSEILQYMKLK